MRWKINKPEHKEGDIRRIAKFALIPITVENHWVWLEQYISIEQYKSIAKHDEFAVIYYEHEWIKIGRELAVFYP